ncbi:MAG: GPP34 family phosphoprotein [Firmicutes bacterium]|nr:GPP34 family phosphoprotein [Bacillota bacterium]
MSAFHLAEELAILALNEKRGAYYASASSILVYGLAGAELLELVIGGRLAVEDKNLVVVDPTPVGDAVRDEILNLMVIEKKPRKPYFWVVKLAHGIKRLKKIYPERLSAQGVLEIEPGRILGLFPVTRYRLKDLMVKETITERLRDLVAYDPAPELQVICLLALISVSHLLKKVFIGEERKAAERKIRDWLKHSEERRDLADVVIGVKKAIQAAEAAKHTAVG